MVIRGEVSVFYYEPSRLPVVDEVVWELCLDQPRVVAGSGDDDGLGVDVDRY